MTCRPAVLVGHEVAGRDPRTGRAARVGGEEADAVGSGGGEVHDHAVGSGRDGPGGRERQSQLGAPGQRTAAAVGSVGGAGVERPLGGDAVERGAAGPEPAGDVHHQLGRDRGVEAGPLGAVDRQDDGVGHGVGALGVEVGGEGPGRSAGVDGDVAHARGVDGDDAERHAGRTGRGDGRQVDHRRAPGCDGAERGARVEQSLGRHGVEAAGRSGRWRHRRRSTASTAPGGSRSPTRAGATASAVVASTTTARMRGVTFRIGEP